ncbi:hypothetical protein D3C72_1953050 [compost metagenome]
MSKIFFRSTDLDSSPELSSFFSPSLPIRITLGNAPAPSFSARIKAMVSCWPRSLPSSWPDMFSTLYTRMLRSATPCLLAGSSSDFFRLTQTGSTVLEAITISGRALPLSISRGESPSAANKGPAIASKVARVSDLMSMRISF